MTPQKISNNILLMADIAQYNQCYEIIRNFSQVRGFHNKWVHFCETISPHKVSAWLLIGDVLVMFYWENPLRVPPITSLGISISHSLTVWHENKADLLRLLKRKHCSSLKKNVFSILQTVSTSSHMFPWGWDNMLYLHLLHWLYWKIIVNP